MHHGDGATTYSQECANKACADGPFGLLTIRQCNSDTGRAVSATKYHDTQMFTHAAYGDPSKNEANVEPVARTFMDAANREFGTSYTEYDPSPTDARDELGYDCEVRSMREQYSLKLQVTRALPSCVYQEQQSKHNLYITKSVEEVAAWLMHAIERKASRASPEIALVLDGVEAPFLGFLTDLEVSAKNQTILKRQRWHSIWVVGSAGARRLSGGTLP